MTTLDEMINLLKQVRAKHPGDIPVILEPMLDCNDAECFLFSPYDIIDGIQEKLIVKLKKAQVSSCIDDETKDELGFSEFVETDGWDLKEKKVIVISTPAYKYGLSFKERRDCPEKVDFT